MKPKIFNIIPFVKNGSPSRMFLVLFGLGSVSCWGLDDPDAITWIPRISTPPVMDGEIDQIWQAQNPFGIGRVERGTVENEADLSGEWYGLWDETYLYFLVDISDQFLESEAGTAAFLNDRIEVFFNMDNVKPGGNGHNGDNYQYAFNWNRPDDEQVNNNTWDGVEWGQSDTDHGYIIEVKIPWTTLTTRFTPEETWSFGFDIAINDNDGNALWDSVTYWWNSILQAEYGNIDGAGTVGLGAAFDGNYSPQITGLGTQIAFEGQSSSIQLVATDANSGDSIAYSAESLPDFVQLQDNGDGTATITVDAEPGDAEIYELEIVASDGSKSDTAVIVLVVKNPNNPTQSPVIEEITEIIVDRGNRRIVEISVVDTDSISVVIEGTTLPDFATLTDNGDKTATIDFSPAASAELQSYAVTVTATDADQNVDTMSFDVTLRDSLSSGAFYCDPVTGDLNNPGSAEAPWSSLEAVLDSGRTFKPGDTIYLRSGHHGTARFSGAHSGAVYVAAAADASPTLSSLGFLGTSAYWHVSGIEISPEFDLAIAKSPALVGISGRYNTVAHCDIFSGRNSDGWSVEDWRDRATMGVSLGGTYNVIEYCSVFNVGDGISAGGSFNVVRGNRIQYFSVDAVRAVGEDSIYEYNYISDNINIDDNHDDAFQSWTLSKGAIYRGVVRGNTIIENTDPDRPYQGPLQGLGFFDGMFVDWVFENNVIIVDTFHGIALYGAINCKIINNTVLDQQIGSGSGPTWIQINPHGNYSTETDPVQKEYYFGGGNLVRNNLTTRIQVSSQLATVDNNQVLSSASDYDAYFVDFPWDLRLKANSPAIDAGSNDQVPSIDIQGNPRVVDGDGIGGPVVDLGAHEFASWRGLEMRGGWSYVGSKYLGWLYVVHGDWVYSAGIQEWIYAGESYFGSEGSWIYFLSYGSSNEGWYFSSEFDTWIYGVGNWGYVLNTN